MSIELPEKLSAKKCPCGCQSWIVEPLFHCQCSSLRKEEAEELVKRWNAYPRYQAMLKGRAIAMKNKVN